MTIFSDTFETGDLSLWDGTTVGAGKTISVEQDLPYQGVESCKTVLDFDDNGNQNCYVYEIFGNESEIYGRCYFNMDTAGQNGAAGLFGFHDGSVWTNYVVYYSSRSLRMYYYDDAGNKNEQTGVAYFDLDTWHCLELYYKTSSGADDGETNGWLDGVEIEDFTLTGLDNDTRIPDRVWIGHRTSFFSNAGSTTYYVDNVVVDTSYIGPLSTGTSRRLLRGVGSI